MSRVGDCIFAIVVLSLSTSAWAIVDEKNMDRWNKPCNEKADKEVPGFLVNLGPTGARAILKKKSFVVKYIFKNSPAARELKLNDEIIGVNGKAFATEHVFGKFYGIKSKPGHEGPFMDFGNAIEESEGKDGLLKLMVQRKGKKIEVRVRLNSIGRFSPTFPVNCRKSDRLVNDAVRYLAKDKERYKAQCHTKATVGLAMLAQGKRTEAKELAKSWNKVPGEGTWTWPVSYQCIFLCEYYLKTRDKSVLKTIEGLVKILYSSQVQDIAQYKNRMHSGHSQAKNFLTGGLGHVAKIDGYGTMSITTLLAMLAWELAEDCRVKVKKHHLDIAYKCIHQNTHKTGYMGYRFGNGAYSPVPRQGLSLVVHKVSKRSGTAEHVKRVASGMEYAKHRVNDGHGDNVLGVFWGLMGIQTSGDKAAIRKVLDYNKAFINMSRTHDGSFVTQPGRNSGDKGYYMSSRLHPTAAMILTLSMGKPKLRIQGGK